MSYKLKIAVVFVSVALSGGVFLLSQKKASEEKVQDAAGGIVRGIEAKEKNEVRSRTAVDEEGRDITILFVGDLMLDRYIRQVADRKGYDFIFDKIDPLLGESDLVVANLEGPITNNLSISRDSEFGTRENYVFTFDPASAAALKRHNLDLVNLGNNHILNFKETGVTETEKHLAEAGVKFFGSPIEDSNSQVLAFKDFKIAFVNYNQFVYRGKEKALTDIQMARLQSDLVVLYAHWGKEYEMEPSERVKDLAHGFVEAGADLIIGSHPHVVQGKEIYQEKTIYYSLGNFIFDQYFQPETREGLAVRVIINPGDNPIVFEEIPLKIQNNGQTRVE